MGSQCAYVRLPVALEEMGEASMRRKCVGYSMAAAGLFAAVFIVFVVFLTLYVLQVHSDPATQLARCQEQLQNQSSHLRAVGERMDALRRERAGAEHERDSLGAQVAHANHSWADAQQRLDSCRGQLGILQENITSQKADAAHRAAKEEQKLQGQVRRLEEQFTNKSKELDAVGKTLQQEREQHQDETKQQKDLIDALKTQVVQLQNQLRDQQPCKQEEPNRGIIQSLSVTLLSLVLASLLL